jgi:arylsulfatase A-like enzyme
LHYFDVHQWSVLEPDALLGRGYEARYDAALQRMDATLRPLLDRRDRVNIVLLADHGEALGAHGVLHHANFVFEELAHIPLLIRVPGSEPATVEVPVSSTGVFNTLRALRGLEPDVTADGSLLALVGATDVGEGPGFAGFDNGQWSFLYGKHRLLYMPREQLVELYDVEQDPREHVNLVDAEPELASELVDRLFQLHNEPPQ